MQDWLEDQLNTVVADHWRRILVGLAVMAVVILWGATYWSEKVRPSSPDETYLTALHEDPTPWKVDDAHLLGGGHAFCDELVKARAEGRSIDRLTAFTGHNPTTDKGRQLELIVTTAEADFCP